MKQTAMSGTVAFHAEEILQLFERRNFPALAIALDAASRLKGYEGLRAETETAEVFLAVVAELQAALREGSLEAWPDWRVDAHWLLLSHWSAPPPAARGRV